MNLAQLEASLRRWKAARKYRQARHAFYHSRSKRPEKERTALARKWHLRVEEATAIIERRQRQIVSMRRRNRKAAERTSGVTRYDGVPVAAWMVPYLQWARENGWRGQLVSGWRDPAYSEGLCRRMCGAPSCPGRCAGRKSNHSGSEKPHGAIDVSEYYHFGRLMERCPLRPQLVNRLGARDPVHFSISGN